MINLIREGELVAQSLQASVGPPAPPREKSTTPDNRQLSVWRVRVNGKLFSVFDPADSPASEVRARLKAQFGDGLESMELKL